MFIVIHWTRCLCSLSTIKSDFTTSNVIEQCTKKKKKNQHIIFSLPSKIKIRVGFRSERKSQHTKSISTSWWGHEFQRIWNCQAVRTRYIVVIKREGMMIMRFDWRLPRQERPWREWKQCYLFALLQAGQWKIHLHCSTSVWSLWICAVFTEGDEHGKYYQQTETDEIFFFFLNKYYCVHILIEVWSNVLVFLLFVCVHNIFYQSNFIDLNSYFTITFLNGLFISSLHLGLLQMHSVSLHIIKMPL